MAKTEFSNSRAPAAPLFPAESSRFSSRCCASSAMNTQGKWSFARSASSSRFGPSIAARPSSSRPGRASARRNSFNRAFCLLCTMRTGITGKAAFQ